MNIYYIVKIFNSFPSCNSLLFRIKMAARNGICPCSFCATWLSIKMPKLHLSSLYCHIIHCYYGIGFCDSEKTAVFCGSYPLDYYEIVNQNPTHMWTQRIIIKKKKNITHCTRTVGYTNPKKYTQSWLKLPQSLFHLSPKQNTPRHLSGFFTCPAVSIKTLTDQSKRS